MRVASAADVAQLATKADLAEFRADRYRALRIRGGAIVAIVAGYVTILAGRKLR